MHRAPFKAAALSGILALGLVGIVLANSAVDGDEPAMMVSPNVVVLAKVNSLTVHTNIVFTSVDPDSVALDEAAPTGVWADDCGHLVARFAVDDLDLAPGRVILTLSGDFRDGGSFEATDAVRVK